MSTGLLDVIKRAAVEVMDARQMSDLRFGTVVSTSPLKVQVTSQFTIPESMLVVPQHLTNHSISCTITQADQSGSGTTGKSLSLTNESEPVKSHTHSFSVKMEGGTSTSSVTFHNALRKNDRVALLRAQGGQMYYILDRI